MHVLARCCFESDDAIATWTTTSAVVILKLMIIEAIVFTCVSAECEARLAQKEKEREQSLQQRLRHTAQLSTQRHLPAATSSSTSSSSSSSPAAAAAAAMSTTSLTTTTHNSTHQASPIRSSAVNHHNTPASAPARAPTLKQAAGNSHIDTSMTTCQLI